MKRRMVDSCAVDIQLHITNCNRNWQLCQIHAFRVYLRPRHDGVPTGVTLPHALIEGPLTWPGQHAGLLGAARDPVLVTQDPNSPAFRMDTFSLPTGTDPARLEQRRHLLDKVDPVLAGENSFRRHQHRAFELLKSSQVAHSFRLDREPDRDRYGRNPFGQSLLLARRLVQAGVPVVQANMGIVQSWDTHADNWGRLKNRLLPWLDRALTALVSDLHAEGRLGDTLVAALGEFGRTPKVSTLPGSTLPGAITGRRSTRGCLPAAASAAAK